MISRSAPSSRAAVRRPPQTQPVSRPSRSGRSSRPRVDQWPKAMGVPRLARPGTSNQGMKPGGAAAAPSLVFRSSLPSALQKRSRVSALTVKRRRSVPVRDGLQRSGSLPYIACRKPGRSGPRSTASTSPARARVSCSDQVGTTPACTISQPASYRARCCCRSQSTRAGRSGAARMSSSVSPALTRRTPWATASRCRSWLPSRQVAALPRAWSRRSVASDRGPRLTRSPSSQRRSREGEKSICASNRSSASQQPWTSPIR
mmetsp:Transcript_4959/g.18007  ORF Transcript_4959/g.18007 Transcript_4959/m.18007 type:complete len:260 (+) Transcript_4959:557-1336(+)